MRSLATVIALIALLGLMAFTNPSMDDFGNYVRQRVIQESQKEMKDPFSQLLGSLMGGLAGGLVSSQTVRTDYIFFSMYELRVGKEGMKALGIFRNFVLLEEPDFKKYKKDEAPAR